MTNISDLERRVAILEKENVRLRWQVAELERKTNGSKYCSTDLKAIEFREAVFRRDDHTCRDCGCSSGVLLAHHIMMRKYHKALQYDVSNGLTLCDACHNARHKRNHWRSNSFDPSLPI